MPTDKKLHLSKENRIIAGVCGGLAEYFETDLVLIRVIFIFFSFIGGGGILLYIAFAIFLSNKRDLRQAEEQIKHDLHQPHHHIQGVVGFFLIIVGVLFLLDNIFPEFGIRAFWPLLLIFLGLTIMLQKHRNT